MEQDVIIEARPGLVGARAVSAIKPAEAASEKQQEGTGWFRVGGFPMPVGPLVVFSDEHGRQVSAVIDLKAARENLPASRLWEAIQRGEEPCLDGLVVHIGQITLIRNAVQNVDDYIVVRF